MCSTYYQHHLQLPRYINDPLVVNQLLLQFTLTLVRLTLNLGQIDTSGWSEEIKGEMN